MTRAATRALFVLAALTGCREPIVVDTKTAAAIPAEIAISGLRELLPKAAYAGRGMPARSFAQNEIKGWSVDEKGVEFRTKTNDPHAFPYASIKGSELVKVPLSYEVKLSLGGQDYFRFTWKDEDSGRRAAEFFESLRSR